MENLILALLAILTVLLLMVIFRLYGQTICTPCQYCISQVIEQGLLGAKAIDAEKKLEIQKFIADNAIDEVGLLFFFSQIKDEHRECIVETFKKKLEHFQAKAMTSPNNEEYLGKVEFYSSLLKRV